MSDSAIFDFFKYSPDACLVVADATIIAINPAGESMFSGDHNLIIGHQIESLFPEYQQNKRKSAEAIREVIMQLLPGRKHVSEWINQRFDGTLFYSEISFSQVIQSGKPVNYLCFRDITGRKMKPEQISEKGIHFHQAIIENAPDGIALVDAKGNFKYVSPSGRRIFGYGPTEEIPGHPDSYTHPDELPVVLENLLRLMDDPSYIPTLQYRFRDKSGNWKWVESTFTNLLTDPSVEAIVVNFRDITNNKLADYALHESEERYRLIFENSGEAILFTKPDGSILSANPVACRIFNKSVEEIIDGGRDGVVDKNDPRVFHAIQERNRTGKLAGEFNLLRRDGTIFPGEISSVMFADSAGNRRTSMIIRDISDRKYAEKKLYESEQRYRLLVDTANEGILVGQGAMLKFVNPMVMELTGYSEEELLSRPFLDFIHPDDRELLMQNQFKRLNGEAIDLRYHIRTVTKEKAIKWIEMGGVKIEWEGQPATMNFVTDITKRKLAEEEIKLQNIKLQKINAEKDKFFSIIAHDIRSPFSGFLGLTQIMADELPSLTMAEIQDIAFSMRNSATNLFRLLENLLQWSLIQQGLTPFNPQEVKMRPVVEESVSIILEQSRIKDVEIQNEIPDDLIGFADHQMLQTVFRNLISNAVKFTPKGGSVNLSARINQDNWIEFSVSDTGIGMSQTMIDELFRLDVQTGRKGTEGEASTGLGLLLCKEFIEKHGGKLWAESKEEKGSRFYFTIPPHASR